ncbi:MAG: hypothetical protein RL701_4826 [Pseudomonadota bacterium]|jgi:type VI secretion system secreted protein Hcp
MAELNPNIFLKIDNVDGNAIPPTYKGQIVISSWSWAVSNDSGPAAVQQGNTRVSGLSLTKRHCNATAGLMTLCSAGNINAKIKAVLTVCRTGKALVPYVTITMSDVLVSHVHVGGAEGQDPMDQFVLQFNTIDYAFASLDNKKPTFMYKITEATSTGA